MKRVNVFGKQSGIWISWLGGGGEPVGRKLPEPPTLHFLEEEFGYFFPVFAFYIKTENNSHKLWS